MTEACAPDLPRIGDYVDYYADTKPDAEALLHADLRLSYSELRDAVDAYGRALLAAGIGEGDRVAAYGRARPEFLIMFLAASGIGAIFVGLNAVYSFDELAYNVGDCEPRLLLGLLDPSDSAQRQTLQDLAEATPSIERILLRDRSLAEFLQGGESISPAELAAARSPITPRHPAALVYTSGSSGRPKGALLPHRGITWCNQVQYEHWGHEGLRVVCDLPINHLACLSEWSCFCLVGGGALYLMERFDPEQVLKVIEDERITWWGAIPTMFLQVVRTSQWTTADLSSLKRIHWGGAPAPKDLALELQRLGVPLCTSYGMTETLGSVTYTADDDPLDVLLETVGRPDPRYDVHVARPDDTPCDAGEEGEVVVRGDFVMLGYFKRPEATAEALRNGALHTGDLGVVLPDGNIKLVGRVSDMFKSGGYNVYPREVELALELHPDVYAAVVVRVSDELYSEVGHAFIVLRPDATLTDAQLRAFVRGHLANYKVPKGFSFVSELPRLPIGKVDKKELRARAEATRQADPLLAPTSGGTG